QAQLLASISFKLGEFFTGLGYGTSCQVLKKVAYLLGRFSHFCGERQLGVISEAEQLAQLVTQTQRFLDDRGIIVLTGVRALVRSACYKRGVNFTAQLAVIGETQYRIETGEVKGNAIALDALGFGIGSKRSQRAFGQAW